MEVRVSRGREERRGEFVCLGRKERSLGVCEEGMELLGCLKERVRDGMVRGMSEGKGKGRDGKGDLDIRERK